MQIVVPEVKTKLEEYDFQTDHGLILPITLDLLRGDHITFDEAHGKVLIHLASKKNQLSPDKLTSEEDITIYLRHIVSLQHRVREVVELTPEQEFEWQKTLKDIGRGTIQ